VVFRPVMIQHPLRGKMWITKNEPPEWMYAEQEDIVNVELANSIDMLKSP
jgi:hypothetical protein